MKFLPPQKLFTYHIADLQLVKSFNTAHYIILIIIKQIQILNIHIFAICLNHATDEYHRKQCGFC